MRFCAIDVFNLDISSFNYLLNIVYLYNSTVQSEWRSDCVWLRLNAIMSEEIF